MIRTSLTLVYYLYSIYMLKEISQQTFIVIEVQLLNEVR